ncbi:hypothetical protein D3C87_1159860 [compost metagenome]
MGLKTACFAAIQALKEGRIQAVERKDLKEKNLLKTGKVTSEEVIELLKKTSGSKYRNVPHMDDASVTVHIFEPRVRNIDWHIKFYFLEPDCYFISVHHSTKARTTIKKR